MLIYMYNEIIVVVYKWVIGLVWKEIWVVVFYIYKKFIDNKDVIGKLWLLFFFIE